MLAATMADRRRGHQLVDTVAAAEDRDSDHSQDLGWDCHSRNSWAVLALHFVDTYSAIGQLVARTLAGQLEGVDIRWERVLGAMWLAAWRHGDIFEAQQHSVDNLVARHKEALNLDNCLVDMLDL